MLSFPDHKERRRRARAAWAYSGLEQRELAAQSGIGYDALRSYLRAGGTASPSMDALLAIARSTGVPDAFMLYGWTAERSTPVDPADEVERLTAEPVPPSHTRSDDSAPTALEQPGAGR